MDEQLLRAFDAQALYQALDAKRVEERLSWQGAADGIWAQSADLNATRADTPIDPSTLTSIKKRNAVSCQHALFVLRWLARAPEEFLAEGPVLASAPLPPAGPDQRLRWDLARLAAALDAKRQDDSLRWSDLTDLLPGTISQLTGIKTVKFAISMDLAMQITQWLGRPAATFIDAATW